MQTQATTVGVDTTLVRSLDWDRDRFDIEFGLEKGTTYNSYIIRGAPGCAALVDSSHEKFRELYLRTLRDEIDPTEIKYIVCSHCLLYTSPSPRDQRGSRMPSSA